MSYTVTINGHKDVEDPKEFEESIATAAREFVAALDGVTSATGSFGVIGSQDLTQPAPEEEDGEDATE